MDLCVKIRMLRLLSVIVIVWKSQLLRGKWWTLRENNVSAI